MQNLYTMQVCSTGAFCNLSEMHFIFEYVIYKYLYLLKGQRCPLL